ncbi:hypothetical protein [Nocardia fusca]|uniref:Uncharacterized protein n=1 Tax=Nocardia fusca TaxID=941183 RepID=A0ABV3F2Z6_9NOCA
MADPAAGARVDYDQALPIAPRIGDLQGRANALWGIAKTHLHAATGDSAAADTAYERAEVALTAMVGPANRTLTSLRRGTRTAARLGQPQVVRIRDEFVQLVDRSVDVEERRPWPLERKGSVFHGGLELSS